jgi:Flp pilus assembly protein TadB|tara:strand:- start:7519 stop:7737 length:219 start_codon:yes stop_codon:yes gene_type:complete
MLPEKSNQIVEAVIYSSCGVGCVLAWLDVHGAGILVIVAVITAIFNIYYKVKHYKLEQAKFRKLFSPEKKDL